MASEWIITQVEEFDRVAAKALDTGNPVVIYCYGNWKEGTTDSWCPDCVDADSIIREKVEEVNGVLIEVQVGDRDSYKGKPENQWRVFEHTKLQSIPTLIRWGADGEQGRLVENECVDARKVAELVKA